MDSFDRISLIIFVYIMYIGTFNVADWLDTYFRLPVQELSLEKFNELLRFNQMDESHDDKTDLIDRYADIEELLEIAERCGE